MNLPNDRLTSGNELLALLDRIGFDVACAAWAHMSEPHYWQFHLFTDMVDREGSWWVWERLLTAFSKLGLPEGMTALDIFVGSSNNSLARYVLSRSADLDTQPEGLEGLPDYEIDRLWPLRISPAKPSRAKPGQSPAARRFDKKIRELLAA